MNENINDNSNLPWGKFKGRLPQMVSLCSKATASNMSIFFPVFVGCSAFKISLYVYFSSGLLWLLCKHLGWFFSPLYKKRVCVSFANGSHVMFVGMKELVKTAPLKGHPNPKLLWEYLMKCPLPPSIPHHQFP